MTVINMHSARLSDIKNWLSEQPEFPKNPYRMPVKAMVPAYIPAVDPMSIHCQRFELEFSQFSRQVSDQECAKSTRRTSPRRMNMVAPIRAT